MGILEDEPAQYGEKTTTGVLRDHLFHSHVDTWIPACDSMGLKIEGKEKMQAKVKQWRAVKAGEPVSKELEETDNIPPFSDEALLDAIAELVTCDDLVSSLVVSTFEG